MLDRQMFFTNENPVKMSIMRATMDGADGLKLFNADHPGDLAVDKQGNKLYWTDITLKKIEYGDLTGEDAIFPCRRAVSFHQGFH